MVKIKIIIQSKLPCSFSFKFKTFAPFGYHIQNLLDLALDCCEKNHVTLCKDKTILQGIAPPSMAALAVATKATSTTCYHVIIGNCSSKDAIRSPWDREVGVQLA